jgi:heptose I phosphotransferase
MEGSIWRRLIHGVRRVLSSPELEQFAGPDWPDRIMDLPVTDRLHVKQGRSIGRLVLQSEGQSLVIYLKRHYRLPRRHGWLAQFRPQTAHAPGLQEWEHIRWAQTIGLPVADAVAAGEFIGPWGRLQSFIAVRELTGMFPLHQAIPAAMKRLDAAAFRRWKRGLAAELARLAAELHGRRRFHKDLYLCHFYIAEDDTARLPAWRGHVRMIDLHRLAHHPWTWPLWLAKDLAQLWYSSEIPGVEVRDRVAFWRAYRQAHAGAARSGWLRALIRIKVWSYRRHSTRGGRRSLPESIARRTAVPPAQSAQSAQ